MAGTWMAVTKGFGGMRIFDDYIDFQPYLPGDWNGLAFHILYRGARLFIEITKEQATITNTSEVACTVALFGEKSTISGNSSISQPLS